MSCSKKPRKDEISKGLLPHTWRDWAELPRHLLFQLMDRLPTVDDYVRFGAVCTRWRATFCDENSTNINKHCSQPFLLVPSPDEADDSLVLYCLTKRKILNFLPLHKLTKTTYCRGSTFGWLVTLEIKENNNKNNDHVQPRNPRLYTAPIIKEHKNNDDNFHVQLRNPFVSTAPVISLPALDTVIKSHPILRYPWGDNSRYLWKAVLSCDPSQGSEFQVAAILSTRHGVAVFDSRNADWICFGEEWHKERVFTNFDDVIFSTKAKQFYVLRRNNGELFNNSEVLAMDLQACPPRLVQVVPPVPYTQDHFPYKSYLVEDASSGGELLLVHKWVVLHEDSEESTYFEVFRLDTANKTWIQMSHLSGKVLFLGISTSVIRAASDCPGCEPNSVYFTEDLVPYSQTRGYGLPGDGVYNLETGSLRGYYSTPKPRSKIWTSPPIWVEPTLRR